MDLDDFFRGKWPWAKLFRLISQLPNGSRYKAGLMLDPEMAEWIVDHLDDDEMDSRSSFVDETSDTAILRDIHNAVRQLASPILAPHVKKPPRIRPVKGPVPEWKRVQDRRDMADVDDMLAYYGIE